MKRERVGLMGYIAHLLNNGLSPFLIRLDPDLMGSQPVELEYYNFHCGSKLIQVEFEFDLCN